MPLVYKYEVYEPLFDEITKQKIASYTKRGMDYLNDKIGIRRRSCKSYLEMECKYSAEVDSLRTTKAKLNKDIEDVRAEISSRNQSKKKRAQATKEERTKISGLKSEIKEINEKLKLAKETYRANLNLPDEELKKRVDDLCIKNGTTSANKHAVSIFNDVILKEMLSEPFPEEWKLKASSNAESNQKQKEARKNRLGGLPGVYQFVDEAFEKILKSGKIDPKFRYDSEIGQIGVYQHGGGLPTPFYVEDLFKQKFDTKGSRIVLDKKFDPNLLLRAHDRPDDVVLIGERRIDRIAWVELRITPGELLRIPIVYHRELPGNATVHRVCLSIKRSGKHGKLSYSIIFTISPITIPEIAKYKPYLIVGIDRNWRKMGDNLIRFAGKHYDDGTKSYPELPSDVIRLVDSANHLKSIRDKILNKVRPQLINIIDKELSKWKSSSKVENRVFSYFIEKNILDKLADAWKCWRIYRKNSRKDLWEESFDDVASWCKENNYDISNEFYLEIWRKKSKHLYQLEMGYRGKAVNIRRNFYHKQALDDHEKCKYACFEDLDLDAMIRRAFPEENKRPPSSYIRQIVAPGELLAEYKLVFGKDFVIEIDPRGTSSNCQYCGEILSHTIDRLIQHNCPKNTSIIELDRDDVASANIWSRGIERLGATNKSTIARNEK